MKEDDLTFLHFRILFPLLAAVFTLLLGPTHTYAADSWQEEVLLHDGQKVIVERSQTYGGRHEIGQSEPDREHTIRFKLPNTNTLISWTSEYGAELGRTNFNLLALHIKQGVPYLVAEPNLCLSYNKWGRPNPPYLIFKWEANAWSRIDIAALPPEFTTTNLIVNNSRINEIRENSGATGYVPAAYVKVMNGRLPQSEYRSIVREPMTSEQIRSRCDELVNYKGHWIDPRNPFARKYIDEKPK